MFSHLTSFARLTASSTHTPYYAKCIELARRAYWDIDRDVVRGRAFDFSRRFLPDGLSLVGRLDFLDDAEQRQLSQLQGRSYASMLGLLERFIGIKMLELCRDHWYGDQVALTALVTFTHEELKHQELFRRVETMVGPHMPKGYDFVPTANLLAAKVVGTSSWAALALICLIEVATQAHYRLCIEPSTDICAVYRDVLRFHWQEESQHVILDELEWERAYRRLTEPERDQAVDDFIALVKTLATIADQQADADAQYFLRICGRELSAAGSLRIARGLRDAYRWQFIASGLQEARFHRSLSAMTTAPQRQRIQTACKPFTP